MMNTRTSSAPAKIASGTTSHQDTARHRYIKYHSTPSGMIVFHDLPTTPPHRRFFWYFEDNLLQAALSAHGFGELIRVFCQ